MSDYTPTLLPTTPQQTKSTYDYAKALMYGNQQQPVHHWTQGVSNIVNALVGGNQDYMNAQREKQALNVAAQASNVPFGGAATPYTSPTGQPRSFSEGPSSEGSKNSGDTAEAGAISGIESGGDYASLGPKTKTGDRAYGKYQVMGKNIPEWTQAATGVPMSKEEFLASPEAQEAVFKHKFGEYEQKYGPEGAAKAWFAGEQGMKNPNAKDQLGTTVEGYANKFKTAMGDQPTMAFSNVPQEQPGPAAIAAAALRGKPLISTPERPQPAGGQAPLIDPALAPRVPQISHQQMQDILANPYIPEERKTQLQGLYMQQGQIIEVPYPGGKVRIDPLHPQSQQFVPDLQKGTNKIGDMEAPSFGTIQPQPGGGVQFAPAQQPPVASGPRSEVAPPVAPAGGSAPAPAPVRAATINAPAAPATPPVAEKPVQVASLEPSAGVSALAPTGEQPKAEKPTAGSYDRWNPETGKLEKVSDTKTAEAAPPVTGPLSKWAQATPPGAGGGLNLNTFPPQMTEDYARKKAFDVNTAVNEEAAKKGVDFATKKYDTLSMQAQTARKMVPNIDYALALMNDKNFYSGLAANEVLTWNKFKAALPSIFGDEAKAAAAPNEVFNKVISGSILDNMRTALGGLGQVRIAEIDLLKQANASNINTPAANRALLEISRRAAQSLDHLDEMGQAYYSGDAVVDPVDGKELLKANVDRNGEIQQRRGLDVGFDKIARKFVNDHPTMDADTIKNYQQIFKTGIDPREPVATPGQVPTPPISAPEIKTGTEKQFKQGIGVWDGKQWVPKAQ